jgi:hypothetical protein
MAAAPPEGSNSTKKPAVAYPKLWFGGPFQPGDYSSSDFAGSSPRQTVPITVGRTDSESSAGARPLAEASSARLYREYGRAQPAGPPA